MRFLYAWVCGALGWRGGEGRRGCWNLHLYFSLLSLVSCFIIFSFNKSLFLKTYFSFFFHVSAKLSFTFNYSFVSFSLAFHGLNNFLFMYLIMYVTSFFFFSSVLNFCINLLFPFSVNQISLISFWCLRQLGVFNITHTFAPLSIQSY